MSEDALGIFLPGGFDHAVWGADVSGTVGSAGTHSRILTWTNTVWLTDAEFKQVGTDKTKLQISFVVNALPTES